MDGSDLTAGRSRSHGGLLLRQILMFFLPGLGPSSQWSGANGPDAGATWPAPGIHTPRLTDLVTLSAPHAGSKIKLVSADILMCAQIQNQFKGNALGNYHSVDINIFMTLSRPGLLEIEVAERRSKIHHLEWAAGGMWTHSGFLSIHGEPPTCCCVCYVERAALLAVCPFNSFNRKKTPLAIRGLENTAVNLDCGGKWTERSGGVSSVCGQKSIARRLFSAPSSHRRTAALYLSFECQEEKKMDLKSSLHWHI